MNNSTDKGSVKSKINIWKPTSKRQVFVEPDGKIFICYFDRIFQQPELSKFNRFYIKKNSYENQLDIITKYINFFINNYDKDNELVSAYLKVKFEVDDQKTFNEENMDAYISFLYEVIFTDTIIEKINKLVDDNYLDDIEVNSEEKRKKYQKNEKKHLESLEFTNQHIKILLRISFAIKILCPCLFHYHAINGMKIEKDSDNIFRFYRPLFDIFGKVRKTTDLSYVDEENHFVYIYNDTTNYYDKYDENGNFVVANFSDTTIENDPSLIVSRDQRTYFAEYNLYNKLYVYVKAKVNESYANNSPIFNQQEIFGIDLYSVIQSFVRRVIISENIVKYKFNNIWDPKLKKYKENIIGFNKTIIKYQLMYFLKEQYSKNLTEVTNVKNSDGLSGLDKLLMNLSKVDEGITTMADINIPLTIEYIKKRFEIEISNDEIDYYLDNHSPDDIQILLVKSYFAKYFGSYRDLNLLRRRDYITLVILLQKKLMKDLGYEDDSDGEIRPVALPYIISGNSKDRVNTRIIRNIQFTQKVEDSYTFQHLQDSNHKYLNFIKPDFDIGLLSTLINTKYTFVYYNNKDLLGQEIIYSDDKIADEVLFFLTSI